MLEEIGDPDRAESWLPGALAEKRTIMGFGHRVYKHGDSPGADDAGGPGEAGRGARRSAAARAPRPGWRGRWSRPRGSTPISTTRRDRLPPDGLRHPHLHPDLRDEPGHRVDRPHRRAAGPQLADPAAGEVCRAGRAAGPSRGCGPMRAGAALGQRGGPPSGYHHRRGGTTMGMMGVQLNSWLLFEHAPRHFGTTEVVTHLGSEGVHRHTYTDFARRSQQLMHALDRLGIGKGERVATLAWNSYRHLECYFAIPCNARILHTLNLRFSPEELGLIIADADDRAILVDPDLVPLLERVPEADLGASTASWCSPTRSRSLSLPSLSPTRTSSPQPDSYPRPKSTRRPAGPLLHVGDDAGRPEGRRLTPTGRPTSTPWRSRPCRPCRSAPRTACCPRCRCSTPMHGGCPMPRRSARAKQVFFAGPWKPPTSSTSWWTSVSRWRRGPDRLDRYADELSRRGAASSDLRHIVCGGAQPPRSLMSAMPPSSGSGSCRRGA